MKTGLHPLSMKAKPWLSHMGGGGGGGCSLHPSPDKIMMTHNGVRYVYTSRTVASSLEVVRPYCVVITTTPTFAHSLVQVLHKCGTAMAVPAL